MMDSDTIVFCTPNPFKRGQYVEAGIVSGAYFNHYEVPTHTGKMRGHGTCKYAYLKE
ncbi:MAG: hypothetical protein HY365_01345 [Candidatus Aenigmarchaeota archaeon]|nr:hypothetical protein [Candidatus Aenigmarchaeota archaeon]